MPVFTYTASDARRGESSGTVVADTARQARDQVRDMGLSLLSLHAMQEDGSPRPTDRPHRLRRQPETTSFIRETATLLAAGIPLLPALTTLAEQHRPPFRAVLQSLVDSISAGNSLAEAMRRQPRYFDAFCTSIVHVGENTGSLEEALNQLADFRERSEGLKSRITSALLYPVIVCLLGVAVSIFLMTYVVPNLLETLLQADKPLPTITLLVKGLSDALLQWWWLLLLGGTAVAAGLAAAWRAPCGRRWFDRWILRIPLLGSLIRKENVARLAVVLSALLHNGVSFLEAVRITRETLRNQAFREALDRYEQAVAAGKDIAAPLKDSGVFSPMVVQMLAVGQQSGEMESMLDRLAESYDKQVAVAAARFTAVLEPLLIVLLATMIGFIAFATILPILEASHVL